MNIVFITLTPFISIKEQSIRGDLIREFVKNGHNIIIISAVDKKINKSELKMCGNNVKILYVFTGKISRVNVIEKGVNTILLESRFVRIIKNKLNDVKIDLIIYTTPPVTLANVVSYIKKRDGSRSYLMLKDIFPQNAVDIGMMKTSGITGLIYRYFRRKEKKLYAASDRIGCMSQANVEYIIAHNPEISAEKVELCPNSIEVHDLSLVAEEKIGMRQKYGLPADKMIFVYGGNLGKPQGIPFIIECLKLQIDNPNVFFLIVGSGTEYGKLEEFFIQSKPSNMKLMKSIPKDDYDKMIAACDVGMIFLDHRFTIPNFPSRLLGYMQAKLPVLACTDPNTDIGKIIVEGGFGWWCESNDVHGFNRLIEQICSIPLVSFGNNAVQYLKRNYSVMDTYRTIALFAESQTE